MEQLQASLWFLVPIGIMVLVTLLCRRVVKDEEAEKRRKFLEGKVKDIDERGNNETTNNTWR